MVYSDRGHPEAVIEHAVLAALERPDLMHQAKPVGDHRRRAALIGRDFKNDAGRVIGRVECFVIEFDDHSAAEMKAILDKE